MAKQTRQKQFLRLLLKDSSIAELIKPNLSHFKQLHATLMSSPNTTLCSNTDKYMFMPFYPSFLLLK